jgi:N-acyl-phosphatidylethanolamine-hydrolysing phospholipase D
LRGAALLISFFAFAAAAQEPPALSIGAARDDDGRFLNRVGALEQAGLSVTLPFFLRRVGSNLVGRDGAPELVANNGAFLRENAGHSIPTVTWIGHATVLVQMDHVTFLTDPIWSERASPLPIGPRRFVPPGVALEDLPHVDFVLISHNHYDHLDLDTLRALAERSPDTVFYVPLANGELLRDEGVTNVVELDWGGQATHLGVTIHCVESQHWSRRGLFDGRKALWASWAVIGTERKLYFAGDTGWSDGFAAIGAALGPFDLAALPIGAYEPTAMMRPSHLDPEEAVRAGLALGAKRLLGIHFGTFNLTDEPLDEPPRRFRAAAGEAGYRAADAFVLRIGETQPF